jgi:hypothetical protein
VWKALDRLARLAANAEDVKREPARQRRLGHDAWKWTFSRYDPKRAPDLFLWAHVTPSPVIYSASR